MGIQSGVTNLCATLQNNTNVLMDQLNSFEGVRATRPDGTFYCFVDFSHYNKDSSKLAYFLLDKVRVITVPGKEFARESQVAHKQNNKPRSGSSTCNHAPATQGNSVSKNKNRVGPDCQTDAGEDYKRCIHA